MDIVEETGRIMTQELGKLTHYIILAMIICAVFAVIYKISLEVFVKIIVSLLKPQNFKYTLIGLAIMALIWFFLYFFKTYGLDLVITMQ